MEFARCSSRTASEATYESNDDARITDLTCVASDVVHNSGSHGLNHPDGTDH